MDLRARSEASREGPPAFSQFGALPMRQTHWAFIAAASRPRALAQRFRAVSALPRRIECELALS